MKRRKTTTTKNKGREKCKPNSGPHRIPFSPAASKSQLLNEMYNYRGQAGRAVAFHWTRVKSVCPPNRAVIYWGRM